VTKVKGPLSHSLRSLLPKLNPILIKIMRYFLLGNLTSFSRVNLKLIYHGLDADLSIVWQRNALAAPVGLIGI